MGRLSSADTLELETALRGARDDLLRRIYRRLPGADEDAQRTLFRDFASGRMHGADSPDVIQSFSQLRAVEEALKRIDYGVIGICRVCGGCIQPERLRVHPTTTVCGPCEGRAQNEEGASG
jgi:RNA polymerase-binding transcription factor DksA